MLNDPEQVKAAFAEENPGWEAWQSIKGKQWHARLRGAIPPVMLHDDTPAGLAEQVRALGALGAAAGHRTG
jgi:hypothetical protein